MTRNKAKQYLLKYYKGLMSISEGLDLIRHYCLDFGKEEHKNNIETFIFLLLQHPHLFTYCLEHAISEYELKYSVVKIVAAKDPNGIGVDKIITIY